MCIVRSSGAVVASGVGLPPSIFDNIKLFPLLATLCKLPRQLKGQQRGTNLFSFLAGLAAATATFAAAAAASASAT